ncbi:Velvet factor [Kalmanozyma brasiliensis GHG001]|uniref:Velvet domain-containing protein n=1 Tax=Kalmanozyma brasiliensis (strain GHG001) TaxID=1365824 RepID=V5E476_KALBG|nr:Velvet factor [Kalmanozyma brasiliensis GHG001]EST04996.1 Velvet factor [Kalmanozyma brasiliensis GHG001]
MDDDRYYDRGSQLRISARPPSYPAPRGYESSYAYPQYPTHQQPYYPAPSQQRAAPRDAEWAYASSSRSPPVDVPGPSRQAVSYRPRPEPVAAPAPTPGLPSRSEWLVLPSVSHALGQYNDRRRSDPRFSLVIRQQPRRGLAIGNSQMSLRTARSVPIDPPPVCELLIDRSGDEQLLSLPEVFIRAQLVRGDAPTEECLPDARRIEPLVGDTLQSPFNSRIDTREDQSFFVFKELGVRNRGVYRLRFDLFDRVGARVFKIASVYSDAFEVQERRKHPGLGASSALMDALVDRGMKYKLRKANDKANPKKRKSPEDFYYGDERASQGRRQSYAGGEYPGPREMIRPIAQRPGSSEREGGYGEMLPPLRAQGQRLSPTFAAKPPQLPSLTRLAPPQRIYSTPSPLPPHPSLFDNRTLSPSERPALEFRSSSSSSVTTTSSAERLASTPTSSTTDTPFVSTSAAMGLGLQGKMNNPSQRNGSPASATSSGSGEGRPTLPPISSLYTPQARRPSAY